jgi:electron transport complex protein RnfA
MKELLFILFTGVFVNNYVLQKFLGICPFLGVSKKFDQASGMGIAVTFVMLIATAVTYPIQKFLLDPNGFVFAAISAMMKPSVHRILQG